MQPHPRLKVYVPPSPLERAEPAVVSTLNSTGAGAHLEPDAAADERDR